MLRRRDASALMEWASESESLRTRTSSFGPPDALRRAHSHRHGRRAAVVPRDVPESEGTMLKRAGITERVSVKRAAAHLQQPEPQVAGVIVPRAIRGARDGGKLTEH